MREKIRNFCIISHIDHGKSTLADRILEICKAVPKERMQAQFLDRLELERERGITIKAKAVRLKYKDYSLNLIDTPGHVDFSYEVSKTLYACEGAVLLVDAMKGIQAQTLANYYLAKEAELTVIPVVNKIDLPQAEPERIREEISQTFGFLKDEVLLVSARDGTGVGKLLDKIIEKIPPPKQNPNVPLRALVFDSSFDPYKGVVVFLRVFDGMVKVGDKVKFISNQKTAQVLELGFLVPDKRIEDALSSGEVGYLVTLTKTNERKMLTEIEVKPQKTGVLGS